MRLVFLCLLTAGVSVNFGHAQVRASADRNAPPPPLKSLTEMRVEFEAEMGRLRAAAHTNFTARCALDFRWRNATNEIALAARAVAEAKISLLDAKERDSLAVKSRQLPPNQPSRRVQQAEYRLRDAEARVATAKLLKLSVEDSLRPPFQSSSP